MASSILRVLDHKQRRTTVSGLSLDDWSARRREPLLTTHNTHNIHAHGRIRTHNFSKRTAAQPATGDRPPELSRAFERKRQIALSGRVWKSRETRQRYIRPAYGEGVSSRGISLRRQGNSAADSEGVSSRRGSERPGNSEWFILLFTSETACGVAVCE